MSHEVLSKLFLIVGQDVKYVFRSIDVSIYDYFAWRASENTKRWKNSTISIHYEMFGIHQYEKYLSLSEYFLNSLIGALFFLIGDVADWLKFPKPILNCCRYRR